MGVDYRNPEGYVDPVPYQAISNMDREQKRYMPMVYICSAYSGDVEYNVQKARIYSRYAVDAGAIPIAPHLLLSLWKKNRSVILLCSWILRFFPSAGSCGCSVSRQPGC